MILLDTHTLLWLAGDQEDLSAAAINSIARERIDGRDIAVSCITLYEIAMLDRKKRIELPIPLTEFLLRVESAFVVLPIDRKVAEQAMRFVTPYPSDPWDRIIGATALVYDCQLVSRDEKIQLSGQVPFIW